MSDEDDNKPAEEAASTDQNTDNTSSASTEAFDKGPTELDVLKERATHYGISYSPNLKNPEILREKINAYLESLKPKTKADTQEVTGNVSMLPDKSDAERKHRKALPPIEELLKFTKYQLMDLPDDMRVRAIREIQKHKCMRLIRCRIFNNDPAKNDLQGEILTVSNKYVGVVRKFIPFGESTENGYHVPAILVDMMRRKRYQRISMRKLPNGTEQVVRTLAPEFTITELPSLTMAELKELAVRQAAAERVGMV
jgi:hypothetical protein